MQRYSKYWSSLSVLERESRKKKKGELERGRKKWREERKGVQPTGIVWVIRLGSKSLRLPRHQTTRTKVLSALCATAIWTNCKRRRVGFREIESTTELRAFFFVLLWILVNFHPPCCFAAVAKFCWYLILRDRPTVQWACRMAYDIDFYKHFAWLRKVRHSHVSSS